MAIQFIKKQTLVKKTKPKTCIQVKENGFLDEDTGEIIEFATFFGDFVDKYVTLNVTETSQEDMAEASKDTEGEE